MTLETYFPEVRHPHIGGKNVTVAPLKMRQIQAFSRHVGPVASALMAGDLQAALVFHGEALIEAVAVATGESTDWLGDLDADEFVRLAGDVVEVNAGFFVHRVTPALNQTMERLMKALTPTQTPGATPSPSYSAVASAGETVQS